MLVHVYYVKVRLLPPPVGVLRQSQDKKKISSVGPVAAAVHPQLTKAYCFGSCVDAHKLAAVIHSPFNFKMSMYS